MYLTCTFLAGYWNGPTFHPTKWNCPRTRWFIQLSTKKDFVGRD